MVEKNAKAGSGATPAVRPAVDDREVVFTRVLDAPRELVFKMWTERRHFVRWCHPKVFARVECEEMDVRPGGAFRFRFFLSDGTEYTSRSVYREIAASERLVYDEVCYEAGQLFHQARVTVTFEERGNRTLLTIRALLEWIPGRDARWTPDAMREGWTAGWKDNTDLLAAYLIDETHRQPIMSTNPGGDPTETDIHLARLLDAPRMLVFNAWTDPAQIPQWWKPRHFTCPACEVDLRPGGAYRIVMRDPEGVHYPLKGIYHEIVPPARLVMSLDFSEHPESWHDLVAPNRERGKGKPVLEAVQTVTFTAVDSKTLLSIRIRFASVVARDAMLNLGISDGISQSLDNLAAILQHS